ncbi:hypothetical protein nvc1_130 [Namao virus]|nr:hypothetical protein nvc1_130 [Namao virus]
MYIKIIFLSFVTSCISIEKISVISGSSVSFGCNHNSGNIDIPYFKWTLNNVNTIVVKNLSNVQKPGCNAYNYIYSYNQSLHNVYRYILKDRINETIYLNITETYKNDSGIYKGSILIDNKETVCEYNLIVLPNNLSILETYTVSRFWKTLWLPSLIMSCVMIILLILIIIILIILIFTARGNILLDAIITKIALLIWLREYKSESDFFLNYRHDLTMS